MYFHHDYIYIRVGSCVFDIIRNSISDRIQVIDQAKSNVFIERRVYGIGEGRRKRWGDRRVVCPNFGHPALTSSFAKYEFCN